MSASRRTALPAVALLAALAAGVAGAADTAQDVAGARAKPVIRGGIVFKAYCVLCHGERGDGTSRAAKLYGAENLLIRPQPQEFYDQIIRKGGEAVGKSPYMPMWEQELSEEQMSDVTAYLAAVTDPVRRGEVVFKTNCVLCHGVTGDGKGRASTLYDPPPANLTTSDKTDDYKIQIVTRGGAAMNRSAVMPQWGLQLTEQEIKDVVAYLRTIVKK